MILNVKELYLYVKRGDFMIGIIGAMEEEVAALKSEMALNAYKYVISLATLLQSHGSIEQFQSYVSQSNSSYIR